jgi:hypothetical protein
MFRHYYAAAGKESYEVLASAGVKDILISYAYAKRGMPEILVKKAKAGKLRLMADSGAFSNAFADKKAPVTIEGYIEWLQSEKGHLHEYVTFDNLRNRQQTLRNYDRLKEKGFNPLFVDHMWFKNSTALAPHYKSGEKMCWGGMVFNATNDGSKGKRMAGLPTHVLNRIRKRAPLATNAPKTTVHLLGTGTRIAWFTEFLDIVDSCDSTAYLQPAKYGVMLYLKFNDAGWPRIVRARPGTPAINEVFDKMKARGMNHNDRMTKCRHAVGVMEKYFKLFWNRWVKARQGQESIDAGVFKVDVDEDDLEMFTVGDRELIRVFVSKRLTAPINAGTDNDLEPVKVDQVVDQLSKPIVLRSPAVTLVGSTVTQGESKNDVDLLVHGPLDPETRRVVEFRLGRALDPAISERAQFHDESLGGPFTDHVNLYDLVLVPRRDREVVVEMMEKKDDPLMAFPPKDGPRAGVVQVHTRGESAHFDLRFDAGPHLVGWTLFSQNKGGVPDVETTKDARALYDGYTGAKGNKAFKPVRAPAKLQATPKLRQPKEWIDVEGQVAGEGEVGATANEKGVIVAVAKPKVEWGLQLPHFHEYFLSGDKVWSGVLFFRMLVGAGVPLLGGEERGVGQVHP